MNVLDALRKRYLVSADPLRTQRRIELVAVCAGLLLAIQLAYSSVRFATMGPPEVIEPAADSLRVPLVLNSETVDEGDRTEVVERPVFWTSRRPMVVVSAEEDAPAASRSSARLRDVKPVGVFGSGDQAGVIAMVKGKKRRILVGETVSGWTLDSIGETESTFVNGAQRETLALKRGTVSARVVATTAAIAQPAATDSTEGASAPANANAQQGKASSPPPNSAAEEPGLGLGQRSWGRGVNQ